MKLRTFLLGASFVLLLAPALRCQSDSMIHVNQFHGTTVGDKVAAAMQHCPAAPVPCILVLDGSLAAAAPGTMPTLCANCYLDDFRTPWNITANVNSVISVQAAPYRAKGDGTTDDTAAIQAALNAAIAAHSTLCFPPGTYMVSSPIRSDPSETQATAVSRFAIGVCGHGSWTYNAASAPVVLLASLSWSTAGGNTSVLDLRYSSNFSLTGITVNANGISGLDGIEMGERDGSSGTYGNITLYSDSAFGANRAWLMQNCNLIRAFGIQASGSNTGIYGSYVGDSDFDGTFVNSNATNHVLTSSGDPIGSGILLTNSGNLNIRGGKIEWNAIGLNIYDSQGINVEGVNWDWNTTHHIMVQSAMTIGTAYAATSIQIIGNRFLSGGINSDGVGNKTQLAFYSAASNADLYALLVGNSFRAACDLAYDACSTGTVGPVNDLIMLYALQSGAQIKVTASGNDFLNATGVSNTAAVYGNGGTGVASLYLGAGNMYNLPFDNESGGTTTAMLENLTVNHDATVSGNLSAGGGSTVVYRCTVAGALPVGALTISATSCGTSGATDTGMRVK